MVSLQPVHDSQAGLFAGVDEFPDRAARRRYESLVGLEEVKTRLVRHAVCMLAPELLADWARVHFGDDQVPLLEAFRTRPPMFVLAGDVGTGKTALAESFGDAVARESGLPITLFRLSLTARGSGAVGEMTQLLAAAFAEVGRAAHGLRDRQGRRTGGAVLLIDEADALAQSRELAQMHHEDRAGVNELIRGIDDLARSDLPVLVLMCTNRLSALDPAIRRRAAETFRFSRPTGEQRAEVLGRLFAGTPLAGPPLAAVAAATGETSRRPYGWTYSDLTDRLVSAAVLSAFPDRPLTIEAVLALAEEMEPTPPFASEPE